MGGQRRAPRQATAEEVTKERKAKRFRVHGGPWWLHALDPLRPYYAHIVRSEWTPDESQATEFPSRMYADEVAKNAPSLWYRHGHQWRIERIKEETDDATGAETENPER